MPMQENYTEDDLVRFIYNEVTPKEYREIKSAIESSPELSKTYLNLYKVVKQLDMLAMEPQTSTVDIIVEHSQHSSHLETSF